MELFCIFLFLALIAAAVAVCVILRRRTKPLSGGMLTLVSAAFCVLFGVDTFFLCFFADSGITAVPIVLIVTFAAVRVALGQADAHGVPAGTRRSGGLRRPTFGSNTKKTKRFLLSSGSVALVVAAAVLLNLVCTNLSDRFDWNFDLTASKMYSISEDTYTVLDELSGEVDVTILLSEDDLESSTYGSYIHTLLGKYTDYSDKIVVTYIDPYKNPSAVDSYSDLSSDVSEGSIIVQSGDNSRVLNLVDFYDTTSDSSSGYTYVTAFRGESTLTSSILSVTSEDTPHAYILQGHNESVSNEFTSMLETSGYAVDTLTLTENDIPEDATMLVISLPQVDYTEDEVNALDDFVKNGGDLLVFEGTESPTDLNVLQSYLTEWGITVNADMVLDSDYNISNARYILSTLDDSSSVNEGLSSKSDQVIVSPDSKSLTVGLPDDTTDRTVESLLASRDTSYAKAITEDTTNDSYDKAKGDTDGPFTLAALAEYTGNDNGGQVMVCSSALMMTDELMQSSSLLNKDFFSNTISAMQPNVEMISIDSKSMDAEPLTLSTTATYLVFVVLLFIPLFLFVYGILVFLRRRHL